MDDIRAVHGREADFVRWNGIRQFMVSKTIPQREPADAIDIRNSSQMVEYGSNIFPDGSGMLFAQVASVAIDPGSAAASMAEQSYKANGVARFQTFVWEAGASVFELVAPNCSDIFTMQSLCE